MYSQSKAIAFNGSGLGCWLTVIGLAYLLGVVGLGWIVQSLLMIALLVIITPVIGFFGFRWWLRHNLVSAPCPVCSAPVSGLKNRSTTCLNCGTPLSFQGEYLQRATPEGTVEVSAVDITGDDPTDARTITVEVLPPTEDPT